MSRLEVCFSSFCAPCKSRESSYPAQPIVAHVREHPLPPPSIISRTWPTPPMQSRTCTTLPLPLTSMPITYVPDLSLPFSSMHCYREPSPPIICIYHVLTKLLYS